LDELAELNGRARELLAELAENPSVECERQFDALLYEFVWRYLRHNAGRLKTRVAAYLGVDGAIAPDVRADEVDEVAHDATTIALRRVREKAERFDPRRGTPAMWVIGAAEFAYVEVSRALVHARRSPELSFQDPDDLLGIPDASPSTEEHVLSAMSDGQALADAASHLSEQEFAAIRLVNTLGFSHAEVAEMLFGEESMSRSVEGLLTRGRPKLAQAWQERRGARSPTASVKVSEPTVDQGREHE
jgi:DNA-directed RNA polymerase specialized sigma24 family protein